MNCKNLHQIVGSENVCWIWFKHILESQYCCYFLYLLKIRRISVVFSKIYLIVFKSCKQLLRHSGYFNYFTVGIIDKDSAIWWHFEANEGNALTIMIKKDVGMRTEYREINYLLPDFSIQLQ